MSTLTVAPIPSASNLPFPEEWTLADLLEHLGGIPASRVLLHPTPGSATEADVIRLEAQANKRLCELIDGVLVEKAMGYRESRIALILGTLLENYLFGNNIGAGADGTGMMRLNPQRVRIPDLSFVSWDQFPNREVPATPIPSVYPNLAVEVLSVSNTAEEMRNKREDYFSAGTKLVWEIDPQTETVRVFTEVDDSSLLTINDTLDGADVLPGFRVSIREMFERARRGNP